MPTAPLRPIIQAPLPGRRAPAVLVVDDESDLRELLSLSLGRLGFDADTADCLAQARQCLERKHYDLCLTDMRLPDGMGLELVREVAAGSGPPIAVITAYGSAENAVAALKAGAFDYLTKPVDLDQLRLLVRSVLRAPHEATNPALDAAPPPRTALDRLLGDSAPMQHLRAMIGKLARSMAPVVIWGESGSGKELAARAIHDLSARAAGPFVAVNCGAIPETLMEAEFFGYRKGAFTGAERDRAGFFQAAAGGTLFLDEVAELPLLMQVKLLRAIQERRVRKVGSTDEEPVDVRLLSASHRDLGSLVTQGKFRQDLFYRLNVIELRVPPLRERPDDIAAIAHQLLLRFAQRAGVSPSWLSARAQSALWAYSFPGNVRELENILERAVALAPDCELQPEDLGLPAFEYEAASEPDSIDPAGEPAADLARPTDQTEAAAPTHGTEVVPSDLGNYLDGLEAEAIRAALTRTDNNRTAAAQLLGITFRQLRYRMQRLDLK